ncbi:MAG: thiamine phosphate synthase [Acidobacteriota bacterium]|nr:thiamine phosphate synthase [Acidobacteriota bacterium]
MSSAFLDALNNTRLYPLTDRRLSGLSHAEQVSLLGQGGATVVQLREKTLSPREFYDAAVAALRVARERKITLIINDRVDIALALKADGVHLGQDDLSPVAARSILGPEAIIGFSTHTLEQALAAMTMPIDYIAIGPIFGTSTKETADSSLSLDGLRRVRHVVNAKPLVAIGGLTLENSAAVLGAGADALAIISDIWGKPQDAVLRTKTLVHATLPYR